MKFSYRSLTLGVLAISLAHSAHSQTRPPAPDGIQPLTASILPVKNVAPSAIVSWLGTSRPKTRVLPPYPANTRLTEATPIYTALLPEGIENIVADDAKNELLVFGTPEAVQQLQRSIGTLDTIRPQVEIETRVLWLKPQEIERLGLNFGPRDIYRRATRVRHKNEHIGIKISPGELDGDLTELLTNAGLAETIARSSVVRRSFINNLTGLLPIPTSPSTKALLTATDAASHEITPTAVTPTLNYDDTVTVLLQPNDFTILAPPGSPVTSGATQNILNIGDNKTRVLWFSDHQEVNAGNAHNDEELIEMALFITPHIVKSVPPSQP